MEKKELKYTKRKLTIIFTIMIFLLVFVLGFSYFIFRYFSEKNQDVNSFISFVNSVSNSEISKEDILNRSKEFPKPKVRNVVSKKIDKKVNYLFFWADWNVVSSDLRFNISDENYEQILKFRKEYLKNNVSSSSWQTHYYEKKVYYEYDDDDDEPELETKYEKVNVPQNTKNSSKVNSILGDSSQRSLTDSTISNLKNNNSKGTNDTIFNPNMAKNEQTSVPNYNVNLDRPKNSGNSSNSAKQNTVTTTLGKVDNKSAKPSTAQTQQQKIDEKEQRRTEKALADAIRRASKRKDSKSKDTDNVNATPSDKNIEDVINKKAAEYK